MDTQDLYESLGTTEEIERQKYDRDSEMRMDAKGEQNSEAWYEMMNEDIEELQRDIDDSNWTIEQMEKHVSQQQEELKKKKELLASPPDNF